MLDGIFLFYMIFAPTMGLYWLSALILLTVGGRVFRSLAFIEFLRRWLVPLFWANLLLFLTVELIYSLAYWLAAAISLVELPGVPLWLNRLMGPFYSASKTVFALSQSGGDSIEGWILTSLSLFVVCMAPYWIIFIPLQSRFKQLSFRVIAQKLSLNNASFSPHPRQKLIPDPIALAMAIESGLPVSSWLNQAFEDATATNDRPAIPTTFKLTSNIADLIAWQSDSQAVMAWELQLSVIMKKAKDRTSKNSDLKTYSSTIFDGVVIKISGALATDRDCRLFALEQSNAEEGSEPKMTLPYREQSPWDVTHLFDWVFRKDITQATEKTCTADDVQPASVLSGAFHPEITYAATCGRDLMLFIETKTESRLFDLNPFQPVQQSLAEFKAQFDWVQHLASAQSAISEAATPPDYGSSPHDDSETPTIS